MNTFYLDRKNVDFQPGKSLLNFKLVHGDSLGIFEACLITVSALPIFLLILFSLISTVVMEIGFLRRGITTDAALEACAYEPSGTRGTRQFALSYSYVSSDGQLRQDEDRIVSSFADCDTIPVGSTIQIQYIDGALPDSRVIDSRFGRPFLETILLVCAAGFGVMVIGGLAFVGVRSLFRYVRALRWMKRLPQGNVLNGEIVECQGDFEGKHNTLFHVYVRYRFTSPQGVELSRKQGYLRDDLIGKPLPTPGTPVKVLYVSDSCHVML